MVTKEILIETDAKLVKRIRGKRALISRQALEELLSRHRPFVHLVLNNYRQQRSKEGNPIPPVAEDDDLIQAGWLAMQRVASLDPPRGWDPNAGTTFITFARRPILWAIQDELQRITKPMNTGYELEHLPASERPEPIDVTPYLAVLTPVEAALITGVYGLAGIYKANPDEDQNGMPGSIRDMGQRLGLNQVEASKLARSALAKMRSLGYCVPQGDCIE